MKPARKYPNPTAFRQALEERLQAIAKKENVDLERLRREVAFDRLLARLFSQKSHWLLKGGYAMELWIKNARMSKDIDLAFQGSGGILGALQEGARIDLGDYFSFIIGEALEDAEKLHAYTRPRKKQNSRVRDLVDMVLLIKSGRMDNSKTRFAAKDWETPYAAYAQECGLAENLDEAFNTVESYFLQHISGA